MLTTSNPGVQRSWGLPGFLMPWHQKLALTLRRKSVRVHSLAKAAEAANPAAPTADDGPTLPPDALRNIQPGPSALRRARPLRPGSPERLRAHVLVRLPTRASERSRTDTSARRSWDKISLTVSILEWDALSPVRSKHLFCFAIARAMTGGHDICISWIGI